MEEKDSKVINATIADVLKLITERFGAESGNDEDCKEHVANIGIVISEVAAKYIIATTKSYGVDEEYFSEALFKSIRKCVKG